jgi:trk system potassium uptake protein
MKSPQHNHIIIVGCGRVGGELAESIIRRGVHVAIIDSSTAAFDRLPDSFNGRIVHGDALDRATLERAGIASAYGLTAVTTTDSTNIVVTRVARDIYHVPHVIARVYDPGRTAVYEELGLQTIASSSWGAQRIEQLLLHPGLNSLAAAGNGEVQVYEVTVPEHWKDRTLSELLEGAQALPVAVSRGGRAHLPEPNEVLHRQDIIQVSATMRGAAELRRRLLPETVEGGE